MTASTASPKKNVVSLTVSMALAYRLSLRSEAAEREGRKRAGNGL